LFKRNEKKNRKDTPTPKMPFADRFSCCATIDFNSILKYFPRDYHNKFYIKIFGIYPTIDLWKNCGGYFYLNEMIRKIAIALQHQKCLSLPDSRVARLSISILY